jgi:undecaprenyl-diphosphatase
LFDANRKSDTKKVYGYVVAVLGALVARFFIGSSIRFFYHRPRPFLALHIPHLLTETSYSFPSGHTIFLFALATGIWFVNKKQSYVLFVLALLVGLARVAAGVHYPSDIAGGIILGVLTAVLVVRLIAYVCGRLKQCKLC